MCVFDQCDVSLNACSVHVCDKKELLIFMVIFFPSQHPCLADLLNAALRWRENEGE